MFDKIINKIEDVQILVDMLVNNQESIWKTLSSTIIAIWMTAI